VYLSILPRIFRWFVPGGLMSRFSLSVCLVTAVLMFSAPSAIHAQELPVQEQEAASGVVLSETTVTITSSRPSSTVGENIELKAKVVGSAGAVPGGTVQLKSDTADLGEYGISPDGTASVTIDNLALGQHRITAIYSGDEIYASSRSAVFTQVVGPKNWMQILTVALPVVGAVILAAVFLLGFRIIFRYTVKVFRAAVRLLSIILKPVLGLLRRLKIISPPRERPAAVAVGVALGSVATAMTETDEELKKAFETQNEGKDSELYTMDRELSFRSLIPKDKRSDSYTQDKIPRDYERAKDFFSTEVDSDVNALNLYDDIDNAFIVRMFGKSDYHCFVVLSEFKKVITSNITKLTVFTFALLSLYVWVNILFANSIDVLDLVDDDNQRVASIIEAVSASIPFDLIGTVDLSETSDIRKYINKFVFGLISFIFFYLAIAIIYKMGYRKEQEQNATRMQAFLKSYLSELANRSEILVNTATLAVTEISGKSKASRSVASSADGSSTADSEVENSEAATAAQYIETLHWTALRVFFIEKFLRNIVFQINRNYSYSVIFIPLFFLVAAMLGFASLNSSYQNYIHAGLSYHSSFYLFLFLLIWSVYDILKNCIKPVQTCVEQSGWRTFSSLSVVSKIKSIMMAYETQLNQWRNRGQLGV